MELLLQITSIRKMRVEELLAKTMLKKTICGVVKTICYIIIIVFCAFQFALIVSKNKDKTIQKYKKYYAMLLAWMEILENGKSLSSYLKKTGLKNIAVYGGRNAGKHFAKQLLESEVTIRYIIDKADLSGDITSLPVYHLHDELPAVDGIIVTPIWDYQSIKNELEKIVKCPIISLEDIIAGVENG